MKSEGRLNGLTQWLYGPALKNEDVQTLTEALFLRLDTLGFGVDRLNIGVFVLHPELAGLAFQMVRGESASKVVQVEHAHLAHDVYLRSPIRASVHGGLARCWDLTKPEGTVDFPFLAELRSEGYTGYAVIPLLGTQGRVHAFSVATRQPHGFPPEDWALMLTFARPLALLIDALTLQHLASVLLRLYVGPSSGDKVLRGLVKRGDGGIITSAILFSDMRNFTPLTARLGPEGMVPLLNDYMELVGGAIEEHGGEIVKFVGDALLAIFPFDEADNGREACAQCLQAASVSCARLARWTEDEGHERGITLRAGFGLHAGDFHFGNVGTKRRLDFATIGDGVNRAARYEALTKSLGQPIVCSYPFAARVGVPFVDLGRHHIKGIRDKVRVLAPRFDA